MVNENVLIKIIELLHEKFVLAHARIQTLCGTMFLGFLISSSWKNKVSLSQRWSLRIKHFALRVTWNGLIETEGPSFLYGRLK